jgi:hypothetical protein
MVSSTSDVTVPGSDCMMCSRSASITANAKCGADGDDG